MTLLLSPARRRRGVQALALAALAATPLLFTPAAAQEQPAPPAAATAPATVLDAAPGPAAAPSPPAPAAQPSTSQPAPTLSAPAPSATAAQPETPAPAAEPAAASGAAAPAPAASSVPAATPAPATAEPASAPAGDTVFAPEAGAEAEPEAAPGATLPHDLSPWGMFMAADIVVKGVMAGLAFASVVTFTILFAKAAEISFAKARARRDLRRLIQADTLAEAIGQGREGRWRGPVALLARSAEDERRRSAGLSADGVKERVAIALQRVEAGAGRSITRGTGLLATIGSTAPFVGLFGTVWGIMNSFIGISQANTTNLAVVAPGIAEALLATAIGLVAAIPAVVIYNVFARSISGYRAILSDGSALVMQHLSRQLDRAKAEAAAAARPAGRVAQAAE